MRLQLAQARLELANRDFERVCLEIGVDPTRDFEVDDGGVLRYKAP